MTILNDAIDRDRLLDSFPLSEDELDRLIAFYEHVCSAATAKSNNDTCISSTLSLSQVCRHVHDGGEDHQEESHGNSAIANNISTKKIHETFSHKSKQEQCWLSALSHVEEHLLPEISSPYQWFVEEATKSASPLLPYDITEEASPIMYKLFYFLEATVSLLGRRGARFLPNFVYDTAMRGNSNNENNNTQTSPKPEDLVDLVYRHVLAALYLQECIPKRNSAATKTAQQSSQQVKPPNAWILSLKTAAAAAASSGSSIDRDYNISRPVWTDWVNNTLPESMRGISTFYHYVLFSPSHPFGPTSPPPFSLPQPDKEFRFWNCQSDLLPLSLGCMSRVFGGNWYRLYSSIFDGFSFGTFQNSLLGYAGPTVILIRRKINGSNSHGTGVFGYYTDCEWKESNTWYGGDSFDSFLFKLDQHLSVFFPTYEANGHYMYLNTASSTLANGQQNNIRGLAIGGISSDTPRVHLTPTFENCKATSTDTTYVSGPLVDPDDEDGNGITSPFFDVDSIEVWAVNVASEKDFLQNQKNGQKRVAIKETARHRAAQVDRTQFLDDFKSGFIINKLFGHREEARGRHDFVAASKRGSGYFVESKPPSRRLLQRESTASNDDEQAEEEKKLFG